jgi:acyl-coenzyme A thioesterase PaaI-like protein
MSDVLQPPRAYELDDDAALVPVAGFADTFQVTLTDRWNIGPVPNGGYVMLCATRALAAVLGSPSGASGAVAAGTAVPEGAARREPLTVTGHFLRPARPGPATLEVRRLREGKSLATGEVSLSQEGHEVLRVLGTFGPLGAPGPRWVDADPPRLPPVEECVAPPVPPPIVIAARFEHRMDPAALRRGKGDRQGPAILSAYSRFVDYRPVDPVSLVLFADALPPPSFAVLPGGWVPTIELTVHVRARPVPGWLRCQFRTRFVFGGFLEEDGEIWDESGQLVAQSRQLAAVPRST